MLTCILSDEEKMNLGLDLADKRTHENRLKSQLKSVNSQLKSEIDSNTEMMDEISDKLRLGSADRLISCTVEYDTPSIGLKTIIRTDTGADWIENMSDDDYTQVELSFESSVIHSNPDDNHTDEPFD
jgi:hypothetical protein